MSGQVNFTGICADIFNYRNAVQTHPYSSLSDEMSTIRLLDKKYYLFNSK